MTRENIGNFDRKKLENRWGSARGSPCNLSIIIERLVKVTTKRSTSSTIREENPLKERVLCAMVSPHANKIKSIF